jgi:hypothetical protein
VLSVVIQGAAGYDIGSAFYLTATIIKSSEKAAISLSKMTQTDESFLPS